MKPSEAPDSIKNAINIVNNEQKDNELAILFGLCGFFWLVTYFLIIRRGFLDSTHGMPVVALFFNLSWEFIFSFVYPQKKHQLRINYTWLAFDSIILYQYLEYPTAKINHGADLVFFYLFFAAAMMASFSFVIGLTKITNDYKHGKYTAFGSNLIMSIAFIFMLNYREAIEGQSIYIAASKMLGTLFSFVGFRVLLPKNNNLNYIFILIFIFDLIYFIMLYKAISSSGINPWARF